MGPHNYKIIAFCFTDEGVSFAQNEYRIAESGGSVDLLVKRSTNCSAAVNVALHIVPLTANGKFLKFQFRAF